MRRLALLTCATLFAGASFAQHYPWRGDRDRNPTPPVTVNPAAPQASPLARTATYVCEDLTTVVFTEGQPTIIATTNSGLQLGLAQRPGSGGFRYGSDPYEFRLRGQDAVWQAGNRTFRCRQQ
jgi:hypothetical protein